MQQKPLPCVGAPAAAGSFPSADATSSEDGKIDVPMSAVQKHLVSSWALRPAPVVVKKRLDQDLALPQGASHGSYRISYAKASRPSLAHHVFSYRISYAKAAAPLSTMYEAFVCYTWYARAAAPLSHIQAPWMSLENMGSIVIRLRRTL